MITRLEPLHHETIDGMLDRLYGRLAVRLTASHHDPADPPAPCWVPPAEFVRLVRPHLGWN